MVQVKLMYLAAELVRISMLARSKFGAWCSTTSAIVWANPSTDFPMILMGKSHGYSIKLVVGSMSVAANIYFLRMTFCLKV